MLRCSAASTWICCCTCDTGALLIGARLRLAQRLLQIGQLSSPGPPPGPTRLRSSSASIACGQGCGFGLGIVAARAAHWAACSCELGQALLDALAALDDEADLGLQPPTSVLASYSRPWAWLTWSPAA
jgi:hypothetical protein